MQIKHLIIFALAGIVILIGFNIFNSNRHEQNRDVMVDAHPTLTSVSAASSNDLQDADDLDIASKPLGQQPKAILDKATTQIEQAEQTNQQRLDQMENAQ